MLIKRRELLKGLSVAALATAAPSAFSLTESSSGRQTDARSMFEWHCREFYDLRKALTPLELGFLEHSMELEGDVWGYDIADSEFVYSMITFSHRIAGDRINSSRVAMGSIRHADKLHGEMVRILEQHGVDIASLPDLEHMKGIGWDIEADHLKVYFYLPDITQTQDSEIAALRTKAGGEAHYPMGITSMTMHNSRPDVFEKKLYLAMKDRVPNAVADHPFTSDIVHTNYMITTRRGVVPQVDVRQGFDTSTLSAPGRDVTARYARLGEGVDTIAYQDNASYTIYFP